MYTRNDSLKEISPTSLCIWWQTLIKESQPVSDDFFHFFKNLGWSRILGLTLRLDAAILDLPLFARRPRRIFPTSLTGDVTSEIAEDDWKRGWSNIWIQEEIADFEFLYKSSNFPPSCPDYPWCNYERELLYSTKALCRKYSVQKSVLKVNEGSTSSAYRC